MRFIRPPTTAADITLGGDAAGPGNANTVALGGQLSGTSGAAVVDDLVGEVTGPITATVVGDHGLVNSTGNPSALTTGQYTGCVIVKHGSGTTVAGLFYYGKTDGAWDDTDASAVGTSGPVEIAVAVGTTPSTHGMIKSGHLFVVSAALDGAFVKYGTCYLSEVANKVTFTQPTATGAIVRPIGRGTDTANVISLDVSDLYVELK